MALPAEPRQKMINLMYLVLTALLALNVSAEILNAFKTVDNSLVTTNRSINNSTTTIIESFKEKLTEPESAAKAKEWYPKAEQAVVLTKEIDGYISSLKDLIKTEAGYNPAKGDTLYKEDDQDIATRLFVEGGKGKELLNRLTEYKNKMIALDPANKREMEKLVQLDLSVPPTQNPANNTWSAAYFRMVPTVAAITMLSKFQNDIKTTENRVVAHFHEQVGKVKVRFNKVAAIVGQNSNYLMPGQELEIRAGIGAFSTENSPTITIGGARVPLNDEGMAVWKTTANSIGTSSIPVNFSYVDQDGNPQTYSTKIEYTVGQATTSVALDKMNVLFVGVDNPVSIAGSGGAEQINASMTNGSLVKVGPGKYVARVSNPGDATINVSISGKSAGSFPFRVRTIPDPTPMVGANKSGTNMAASVFRSQAGVRAVLENFFYEAQFNITSFRIIGEGEGFEDFMEANNNGAAWGPQAQAIINRVRPGSIITIEDIRCVGPDGRQRKLPTIIYNIK